MRAHELIKKYRAFKQIRLNWKMVLKKKGKNEEHKENKENYVRIKNWMNLLYKCSLAKFIVKIDF